MLFRMINLVTVFGLLSFVNAKQSYFNNDNKVEGEIGKLIYSLGMLKLLQIN